MVPQEERLAMVEEKQVIPINRIENRIFLIRGQKVMLDSDLAELYGVPTGRLNEQVKRNQGRFPEDFMFILSEEEFYNLISQNAISSWGGRRKLPLAFTEQGVAMLSSVLRSERAIQVNVEIMRAFVKLRGMVANHKELAHKLAELEWQIGTHDEAIRSLFTAIHQLMEPPKYKEKRIGFQANREDNDNP